MEDREKHIDLRLERALAELARRELAARAEPGADLIDRVMADAARVAREGRGAAPRLRPVPVSGASVEAAADPGRIEAHRPGDRRSTARPGSPARRAASAWVAGVSVALAASLALGFVASLVTEKPEALVVAVAEFDGKPFDETLMVSDASGAIFGPDAPF